METESRGPGRSTKIHLENKVQALPRVKGLRRGRTFTGCYNCRARKVKCDELAPACKACIKTGTRCSGYGSRFVWVTADQKTYTPNGRRFVPCESTWQGVAPLSSSDLDHFVSLCDAAQHVKGFTVEWAPESNIPFGAFPGNQKCLQAPPSPRALPRSILNGTPFKNEEAFLFKHYVEHVSFLMMPYEDQRNPWKTKYPSVALHYLDKNHQSLYKALLAQAAYNLAYLDCGKVKMLNMAANYYASAMSDLRRDLSDPQKDYGTFVASIMTLVMVEIYSGNSNAWRTHLEGAWRYSKEQYLLKPWNVSSFAESSTQSLCIIKIVSDTSRKLEQLEFEDKDNSQAPLIAAMSSYPSFGLTIGASQPLMKCISDIHQLARDVKYGRIDSTGCDTTIDISQRLDRCHQQAIVNFGSHSDGEATQNPKHKTMTFYHETAFIAATFVYLHRSVSNATPQAVQEFVTEVFRNVESFFAVDAGNFSLWPVFIAAVEAFHPDDLKSAKAWLDDASKVGMGNRLKIEAVVLEVWRRRQATAIQTGRDLGTVIIDWRDVMSDLNLDIVLV